MSGAPVVEADGLTKFYGTTLGIEDLTFRLEPGEVFGYLGPNGAGKSTTIRTMLDLIRPTRGRIRVFGLDPRVDGAAVHARLGYVPGEFGLYERLTGAEYLRMFASFRGGWTQRGSGVSPTGSRSISTGGSASSRTGTSRSSG